jgi:hypothetical protein
MPERLDVCMVSASKSSSAIDSLKEARDLQGLAKDDGTTGIAWNDAAEACGRLFSCTSEYVLRSMHLVGYSTVALRLTRCFICLPGAG